MRTKKVPLPIERTKLREIQNLFIFKLIELLHNNY